MGFEDRPGRHGFTLSGQREPARAHFRRFGEARLAADVLPLPGIAPEPPADAPCKFDIYRADEVRISAIRFSGGDWHWRLSDGAGTLLVDAGGYHTEDECRKAVVSLRNEAALAAMPGRS